MLFGEIQLSSHQIQNILYGCGLGCGGGLKIELQTVGHIFRLHLLDQHIQMKPHPLGTTTRASIPALWRGAELLRSARHLTVVGLFVQ